MALTRQRARRTSWPLSDVVDELMSDPGAVFGSWDEQRAGRVPSMDVRESDDGYVIEAEMPGIKPEDVEITLDGKTLIVRGRYGDERERERQEGRWVVRERQTGSMARAITLPDAIDAEAVRSTFENGVLKVTLPKGAENRPVRIPIPGAQGAKAVGPDGDRGDQGDAGESRSATDR